MNLSIILSSLTNNEELLFKVNKEISNTDIISADNLKKINEAFPQDKYPDMTKALVQYQKGLINSKELNVYRIFRYNENQLPSPL